MTSGTDRKTFTIERTFKASPDRVWAMLTTREGWNGGHNS